MLKVRAKTLIEYKEVGCCTGQSMGVLNASTKRGAFLWMRIFGMSPPPPKKYGWNDWGQFCHWPSCCLLNGRQGISSWASDPWRYLKQLQLDCKKPDGFWCFQLLNPSRWRSARDLLLILALLFFVLKGKGLGRKCLRAPVQCGGRPPESRLQVQSLQGIMDLWSDFEWQIHQKLSSISSAQLASRAKEVPGRLGAWSFGDLHQRQRLYGDFLKWWVSPTKNMGFPTKNGSCWGVLGVPPFKETSI